MEDLSVQKKIAGYEELEGFYVFIGKNKKDVPCYKTLEESLISLELLLISICKNKTPIESPPELSWNEKTLLKGDLWRIARKDDLFYVQTRVKKNIPWSSVPLAGTQDTPVVETIAAFDNLEAAVLRLIELLENKDS